MNAGEIKVGCIGSGMMGGALMQAVAKKIGGSKVYVSDVDFDKAKKFAEKIGGTALGSNTELAKNCDVVFIAVKPAYIDAVLKELADVPPAVLVSMAAGVKLERIAGAFADLEKAPQLVRIMPNLPATVGEAMIALSPFEGVASAYCSVKKTEDETCALVKDLLSLAGKVEIVPEKLMDAVTAVSGSGPAYAFLFIEALADAAVRFGIPRAQAYTYSAQTLRGAATMFLEDGRSVSELKDAVCSPAGTTIEGVIALERNGFRNAVIEAATAAFEKSVELGKK